MNALLKIITLGVAAICIAPLIITNQDKTTESQDINDIVQAENDRAYLSSFNFSQKTLKLDHEFVQYKIKFHENTTVNYNYFLRFRVKDLHPLYYFIVFTDGEKGIMKREIDGKFYEAPIIGYGMIPGGVLLDINFGKLHFSIGRLLFKLLPIGNIDKIKGNVEVTAGTEWFLTIGIYYKSVDETFYVSLESEKPCLEVIELDRDNKIEFLSALHGDFSGFYCGIKILSRGCSLARNLATTITTSKGSTIGFSSAGHIKGQIKVVGPDGRIFRDDTIKLASFQYYGNQTGTWKFSASGFGLRWKHMVSLFYIDADPHIQLDDW